MELEDKLIIRYLQINPSNAARALEQLPAEKIWPVLEEMPVSAAANVLPALPPSLATLCLAGMPASAASDLIQALSVHVAAGLLRRLQAAEQRALLAALPAGRRSRLQRLLSFRENTAGALMSLEYIQLFRGATAQQAQKLIGADTESGVAYVVTEDQRLTGTVSLRELEEAPPQTTVGALMRKPKTTLSPNTDCSVAVNHPCWYDVDEAPIVSRDRVLLGILRHRMLRIWSRNAHSFRQSGLDTSLELGEFVWLGFQGLLEIVISPATKEAEHG